MIKYLSYISDSVAKEEETLNLIFELDVFKSFKRKIKKKLNGRDVYRSPYIKKEDILEKELARPGSQNWYFKNNEKLGIDDLSRILVNNVLISLSMPGLMSNTLYLPGLWQGGRSILLKLEKIRLDFRSQFHNTAFNRIAAFKSEEVSNFINDRRKPIKVDGIVIPYSEFIFTFRPDKYLRAIRRYAFKKAEENLDYLISNGEFDGNTFYLEIRGDENGN